MPASDNPYRLHHIHGEGVQSLRDALLNEAPGFHAVLLDDLLRQEWANGYRQGDARAKRDLTDEQARAYDEGYDRGLAVGAEGQASRTQMEVGNRIRSAQYALEQVVRGPRSTIEKDRQRVEKVRADLEALVARLRELAP